MPKNRATQRLSSISDAAAIHGVHPSTLRRYVSTGRISGYRFGPRILRVDLDELDAMLRPVATAKRGASK